MCNMQDFYNFMLDSGMDPLTADLSVVSMNRYARYLSTLKSSSINPGGVGSLGSFMNGVVRQKLKIIPENVL